MKANSATNENGGNDKWMALSRSQGNTGITMERRKRGWSDRQTQRRFCCPPDCRKRPRPARRGTTEINETSLKQLGQQMRSGDLPAYLSLKCQSKDKLPYSLICSFVQIQPRVTDGSTDRTHPLIKMRERI